MSITLVIYALVGIICMTITTWKITPALPKWARVTFTVCSLIMGAPATLAAYYCNKWESEI